MHDASVWPQRLAHINSYILFFALASIGVSFYVGETLTLFTLIALVCLVMGKISEPPAQNNKWSTQDKLLVAAILGYFLLDLFDFFYHGNADVNTLSIDPEPLVCLILLPYFIQYPVSAKLLYIGCACGAIVSGMFGIWQVSWLDATRAVGFGFEGPGKYGNLSILLAYIALIGCFWARTTKQSNSVVVLCAIGAVCGLMASVLSGTRGGWLSVPIVGAILLYVLVKWSVLSRRKACVVIVLGFVTIGLLYAIPATNIKNRVHYAYDMFMDFKRDTTGQRPDERLDMWHSVVLLADQAPFFGLGKQGYIDGYKRLYNAGKIGGIPNAKVDDPHNELMIFYMYHGLLGVFVFVLFYGMPVLLGLRAICASIEPEKKLAALSCVIVAVSYLSFGLVSDILGATDFRRAFLLFIVLFWSLYRPTHEMLDRP